MNVIKCMAENIEEELSDAEKYIELAMKWKEEQPEAADLFYELSLEEMGHANKIHETIEEIITEYRQKTGDPPKDMMTLYNYLHERHKNDAMRIKVKQGMYKS